MTRTLALVLLFCGLSASRAGAEGKVRVEHVQTANREHRQMALDLKDLGLYESVAEAINEELRLPRDIVVFFDSCGEANAFYDSESKSIIMCYELLELAAATFEELDLDDEEHAGAVLGVAGFFFLHEMGHALVDVLDIPVTGREEDAVDDLAGLILLQGEAEDAAFAAMLQFANFSDEVEELAFWDEHSLDEQRFYSVACLIYGSNPESNEFLVGDDMLPPERAERCPEEYERKDRAWTALLAPHSRNQ
jgi:hypothetical protein